MKALPHFALAAALLVAVASPLLADDPPEDEEPADEDKAPPKLDKDPDPGLLVNGGFDDTSAKDIPSAWSLGPSKRAAATDVTLRSREADPSSGTKCGEVVLSGEGALVVSQTVNLGASAGKRLVMTFRLKVSQDFSGHVDPFLCEKPQIEGEGKLSEATLTYASGGSLQIEPGMEWREHTFEIELKEAKRVSVGFFIAAEKGGTVWLDGVSLKEAK